MNVLATDPKTVQFLVDRGARVLRSQSWSDRTDYVLDVSGIQEATHGVHISFVDVSISKIHEATLGPLSKSTIQTQDGFILSCPFMHLRIRMLSGEEYVVYRDPEEAFESLMAARKSGYQTFTIDIRPGVIA